MATKLLNDGLLLQQANLIDQKLINCYKAPGNLIVIDSIATHLSKLIKRVRAVGPIYTMYVPKAGYTPRTGYTNAQFAAEIFNFDVKYYTFKLGVEDINFKEIRFETSGLHYIGFVSQVGTNAPTDLVRLNTIGEGTWSRVGVGIYRYTVPNAFTENYTAPIDDIMNDQLGNLYTLNWISTSVIELRTYGAADITVLSDNILNKRYINFSIFEP